MRTVKHLWAVRFFMAFLTVSGVAFVLNYVHDYQRTLYQIQLVRDNDPIAAARPWLVVEYFFNEAGSGMKYFITDNSKHMLHYPTAVYLTEQTIIRANSGDWQQQIELARLYYDGSGVPRDLAVSLLWLQKAQLLAPLYAQHDLSIIINNLEKEITKTHI